MDAPAFCDTCGAVFRSGIVAEDAGEAFSGRSAGPCPVCGTAGRVPDGAFDFLARAIEILSAPQRTADELMRLVEILSAAAERRESPDRIVETIGSELPELAEMADLLPKTGTGLNSHISMTVALSMLIWQANTVANGAADITVAKAMEHIFTETNTAATTLRRRLNPGVRRNAPCPCGSSKRFKRCCGRLA